MHQEGDATWSLGMLIGLPVAAFLFLAFAIPGTIWLTAAIKNRGTYGTGYRALWAAGLWLCALIVLGSTAVLMYPWQSEYHQYVTKVGTVEAISKRIVGGDKISEKFVARFEDGREFGCEDTRCSLVQPGDALALACKRTWQYTGTDGYDCNFLKSERKD